MLLTDSDILTETWLNSLDPDIGILTTKELTGIPPIEGDNSIIRQTALHACHIIIENVQAFSGYLTAPGAGDPAASFIANTYNTALDRSRISAHQVVAMEPEPTRSLVAYWMQYEALFRFFRAIALRKADDRFAMKRDEYKAESKVAWQRLTNTGFPLQVSPLACPGALREYQNGVWSASNVTAGGSGSHETGNTYQVAITYTGQPYVSWAKQNSAESAGSPLQTIQTAAGQTITVSIASLSPPSGLNPNLSNPDVLYSPMSATGWNVYVALAGGSPLLLQNLTPIPIGTASYTLPDAPVLTGGQTLGLGQPPSNYFAFLRTMSRA